METIPLEFTAGQTSVRLPLYRKSLQLGTHSVDHFWLDNRLLYGERKRSSELHSQILQIYWEACSETGSLHDPQSRETFLLASLLPSMRSNGSRRLFADARLAKRITSKRTRLEELNLLLQASQTESMTAEAFEVATFRLLCSSELLDHKNTYCEISRQLLADATATLCHDRHEALRILRSAWDRLQRRFGRRGHFPAEKAALDILSYEARTAFHRCYSVAWMSIKYVLERTVDISPATAKFLLLWHLEHGSRFRFRSFRPFHGHVFALHPAGSEMIQTPVGMKLVGDWLDAPLSGPQVERLLHAMNVSLCYFMGIRVEENSARRLCSR